MLKKEKERKKEEKTHAITQSYTVTSMIKMMSKNSCLDLISEISSIPE